MRIFIITPCSRPENLIEIKKSIEKELKQFAWSWIIVVDSNEEIPSTIVDRLIENEDSQNTVGISYYINEISTVGNMQRNRGLDIANKWAREDDLIYFLDDDNILHPKFKNIVTLMMAIRRYDVVIFGQCMKDGTPRLIPTPDTVKVDHIDTACMLAKYRAIKNFAWQPDIYNADGYYIEQIYEANKLRTYVNKNAYCYYNYLTK